ncbi:ribonuclease J [candidate division SR1 bacterium]|nr:ribonuclease J [candidate division SR1 bacterium]
MINTNHKPISQNATAKQISHTQPASHTSPTPSIRPAGSVSTTTANPSRSIPQRTPQRPVSRPTGTTHSTTTASTAPRAHRGTAYSRTPANPHRLSSENFLKHRIAQPKQTIADLKKLIKKDEIPVKVVSLLGIRQVGQCMFIEYKNDIIIVDAGMEFAAPEELGADYIIPDISYLKQNVHKIRGILITHGHLDHVGALRNLLEELGNPTLYTTPLTLGIIKKTFDDPIKANQVKYKLIDPEVDIVKLGCFTIEFIRVNHNIPESMALAIHTPKGVIFDSGDFKIDYTPSIDAPTDLAKIARIGTEGVQLYIGDSLGAQNQGRAKSEKKIGESLDEQIRNIPGRIFIATFASNIGRVIQIVNSAIKRNRVVFLSGRSLVNNVQLCQNLGYIDAPKGMIRRLDDDVNSMPDERVLVLSTGAQGEEFAALTRMSRGEHPQISLAKGDTVIMSSSTIPGNELAIDKVENDLLALGVDLITNNEIDVHTSGHGYAEDHKLFLSLIKPKFFMPFFDELKHRTAHKKLATDMGMPDENVIMPLENGIIVEMYDDVVLQSEKRLKLDTVVIDGKGKGHLSGEYVIKARKIMAENGVVALIFKIDNKTHELVGNLQIESRGFVYSAEVKKIHTQIVEFARTQYNNNLKKRLDVKENLRRVKETLGEEITKIIGRVPMLMITRVYINREAFSGEQAGDDPIIGMTLEEQGYED